MTIRHSVDRGQTDEPTDAIGLYRSAQKPQQASDRCRESQRLEEGKVMPLDVKWGMHPARQILGSDIKLTGRSC
jgi:hypothetical protein